MGCQMSSGAQHLLVRVIPASDPWLCCPHSASRPSTSCHARASDGLVGAWSLASRRLSVVAVLITPVWSREAAFDVDPAQGDAQSGGRWQRARFSTQGEIMSRASSRNSHVHLGATAVSAAEAWHARNRSLSSQRSIKPPV